MKQYLITMIQPDGVRPPPEFLQRVMQELGVIRSELEAKGSWVFGAGLHDASTATVLKRSGSEVLATDGPFIEAKEHVGGITIIRVPDLDAALAVGKRYAEITGLPIEVRPFREFGPT